jgi:hypothetical protein
MKIKGKIDYKDLGMGSWVLVSQTGETYELDDPPAELCKSNLQVEVTGLIQENVMTIAMVGPLFKVQSFTIL